MITINNYHGKPKDLDEKLERIFLLLKQIQMTEQELLDKITAQTAQIEKVGTEVSAVKSELAAALAAGFTVPPALVDAINAQGAALQAVDDLNPDAPVA